MFLRADVIQEIAPFILQGMTITLKYTFFSLLGGLPLGALLAFGKISKFFWLRWFSNGYTAIFRGTPLLVQLGLFYYATPQLTGYQISVFEAGILTFSLNSAAYTSEIMRTGIQSIDVGQWDAAKVLGFSHRQSLWFIIIPQAFCIILPALVNEMIDLLKESALMATLSEMDLLRRAQVISAEKFLFFEPYLLAAFGYFILVNILGVLGKLLERKLAYA